MHSSWVLNRTGREKMDKTVQVPETLLNSGHKMPVVGFGCAVIPIPSVEETTPILLEAIKIGYRHFDTATLYGTEEAVGKAVAQAIECGLVKGREEFFITSKLWCTDNAPELVMPAIRRSLGKLGIDYLDLYLVHWPLRLRPEAGYGCESKDDLLPYDMHGTWKVVEECKKLGLTKSIGVSNFTCEKLSKLLEKATIPPAVNQVEMNVAWQQRKLLPFCQQKKIHISAASPLGAYGTIWGCNAVMESPVLTRIAAYKSKTVAQVALRWIYQQGGSYMVKSFNKERMIQNLQIFDFELTKEELEQIRGIPQRRCTPTTTFLHPEGLIKTLEELWDGDL